jgi:Universal stress protein UspA and related nucleotide-binding proteins
MRLVEKLNGMIHGFFVWCKSLAGNILVAVDGSENSQRAYDFALDYAEKFGFNLTVVNVSESSAAAAFAGDGMASVARDLHRFHEGILEKAVDHAKSTHPSVAISTVLREGDPATEIVSAATEGNFDVVIVGHRGLGKVKGLILGSISEKVIRSLCSTVILVR